MTSSRTAHPLALPAVLLLVFLIALAPRLLIHAFSLPYIDHPDEPASYLKAQEWRGLYDMNGLHDGYPPAFISEQAGAQIVLEALGMPGMPPAIQLLRIVAAVLTALTAVCIAWTAHRITRPLGGWPAISAALVAGLLWALPARLIEFGVFATPDPPVYLLTAAALAAAVGSIGSRRAGLLALFSIFCGLLAVLFKYSALPAVTLGFLALIAELWRGDRKQRRRLMIYGAVGIGLVAACGVFLLGIYRADLINTPGTSDVVRQSGLQNALTPGIVLPNLAATLTEGGWLWAALALLSPAIWLVLRRDAQRSAPESLQPRRALVQVLLGLWLILSTAWVTSAFSDATDGGLRFLLPGYVATCVLAGVGLISLPALIDRSMSRRYTAAAGLIIALAWAVITLPPITSLVAERQLPDSRVELRQWADANLPPGTVLVTRDTHKTFNPFWGGIPYQHWFDWIEEADFTLHSPAEWKDVAGADYLAYPPDQWEAAQADAGVARSTLELGTFGGPGWRGPQVILVRNQPLQNEHPLQFGDSIRLLGFEFDDSTQSAEALPPLRLFWEAVTAPSTEYSLFLHLVDAETGAMLGQSDGPQGGPDQPTYAWRPGMRYFSGAISLPAEAVAPGQSADVLLGLYDFQTGQRLPVDGTGSDSAVLFTLTRLQDGTLQIDQPVPAGS